MPCRIRTCDQRIRVTHALDSFDSGVRSLDDWLRRQAMHNRASGASRTFVACDDARVAGYYALAASAVAPDAATGRFRRKMPDPVPVAVLGRLAIDKSFQGTGLGRALFRDGTARAGCRRQHRHPWNAGARDFG